MSPKARRLARQYALQAIYQWQLSQTLPSEIEAQFLNYKSFNRKTDLAYFKELLHGVPKQMATIDGTMTPYLDRPVNELDPIELSILRLSIYELLNRLDVPRSVVINEALELTKKFGSVEGHKFVNGVLDPIAHHVRKEEALDRKK